MRFPIFTGSPQARRRFQALAAVAVAGAMLPALPARAHIDDLTYNFKNDTNHVVRGTIANQGKVVYLKPGQLENIKSQFSGQNSSARHVIRFLPHLTDSPAYCEWIVDIKTSTTHPYWTCTVSAAKESDGEHCAGYAYYQGNYNCWFDFVVK